MSEFHYIQMPPDGTGKRSAQSGTIEIHYSSGTTAFELGDTVTTDAGVSGAVIQIEGSVGSGEIYLKLGHGSNTSADIGDALKVGGVQYAQVSQDTADFYTQEIVITGGNNPFNSVTVSDQGALFVQSPTGVNLYDAFGKLQTSQTTTIREYQPIFDTLPDEFSETVVDTGSITWDSTRHLVELMTGTGISDSVLRRSNLYHKYQTGVATTVMFSMFLADTGKAGVHRKVGYYDDSDGVYFYADEVNPAGMAVVVRSSVTGSIVENIVYQDSWNTDRLDGSGGELNISRKLLDPSKIQIMFIDFQWLGGGRVRFGFIIDGLHIVCHEFNHANTINNPYMRTGSLPFTMEQFNTSAPASPSYMYHVSAKVACEGEFTPREYVQGGISEPFETFADGAGLTVDIVETVANGILTDAEIAIAVGGTNYEIDDEVIVTGGNNDAVLKVTTAPNGVVTGLTVVDGGTGYSNGAGLSTVYQRTYKHLLSFRSSKLLGTEQNRVVALPLLIHITEISGSTDPYQIEFVKNDILNGTVTWLDPYPNNALESTNRTIGGITSSGNGEVLFTEVAIGKITIDMTKVFTLASQLIIRKADIDDEPDHYSIRIKPVKTTGNVELIAGMTWKEYR